MARKSTYQGDGLRFYNAVSAEGMTVKDLLDKMGGIVRQTLYNYYERNELDNDTKHTIAKALDKEVDEIFGLKSKKEENIKPIQKNDEQENGENTLKNSEVKTQSIENQSVISSTSNIPFMKDFFKSIERKDAQIDRLITIIERMAGASVVSNGRKQQNEDEPGKAKAS